MLNKNEIKDKPICKFFLEYNDVRKNLNNALMFDIPDLAWTFSDLSAAYGAGIIAAKSKNVDINISKILSGNPLYATCS